jgi:predicted transcriptional regulator of viral defense system
MEAKHIRQVFREHRWILSTRQALDAGVHPVQLYALAQSGKVEKLKRGLFRWAGAPFDEKYSLIVAHREVPDGVVCLLSALQFHGLTTQAPFEIWVTVKRGTAVPDSPAVPLRVFRSSGPAYREGIERHRLKGVTIKVYSVARTIADCFKYRNKIGLDVALEALREGSRKHKFTVDELMYYARVCRVANIIRPYAEAVV